MTCRLVSGPQRPESDRIAFRPVARFTAVAGLPGHTIIVLGSIAGRFDLVDASPDCNGQTFALPVALFEIILLPGRLPFRRSAMPEALERILYSAP